MKQLTPVRIIKNKFFQEVSQAELEGATVDELKTILGRARAKKGCLKEILTKGS
jgi:enoyl-[acyl-carrier protein] reductase II